MSSDSRFMLLFSLGPVQSFIAQARKTRDLWLGSFLLSVLMQESMKDIHANLIFPHKPRIEKNIPDLPNKYIAIFDTSDEAVEAARKSEKSTTEFWKRICEDVWRRVFAELPETSPATRQQWEWQIDPAHMFEFFWVVVAGSEDHYKEWLTETQLLFDRRKHLRDFAQQVEAGEKSTVSGQRAALRGAGEWRTDVQTFWYHVARKQSPRDISQDSTERLDAIDTVKRFAHLSKSLTQALGHQTNQSFKVGFPSTSSIATASFVEQLLPVSDSLALASALSDWLNEAHELGETMPATIPLLIDQAKHFSQGSQIIELDGDCFFPETFSENRLQKEFGFDHTRTAARQRLVRSGPQAIAALLRATDALTPPLVRPRSYYAMIQMDGDKMGRLINGVKDRKEHEAICQALSLFSRQNALRLVEKDYPGRLIYAGGDDVFALAPLRRQVVPTTGIGEKEPVTTVLELVDRLQQAYHTIVQDAVEDDPSADPPVERKALVSASTGIAIAHHYTSLSYVRRISKEAEQLAKNRYGRNALVVTVLRRSGEQTRVGCHWHYNGLDPEAQPMKLFSTFYTLFAEDILSPKCVYNLLAEAPTLVGLEEEAQESEIRRVLLRQLNSDKNGDLAKTSLLQAGYLVKLAMAMDREEHPLIERQPRSIDLHAERRRYGLVEVFGWLLVILFLVRKEHE